ncbi:MAG TPA: N-acetylmannosamine-6-phosphate 2-epimerase [Candidatus Dormibacteraeota bacterium]|nr:N-acetylmannosamine-6-phosphate 2-epimerase [Candidatus Dormibacteraeota bacterium]
MSAAPFARGLVVSVQAEEGSPLDDPLILAALGRAAERAGAVALRAQGEANVRAMRARCALPVIGLLKRRSPGSEVYITPTLADARAVAAAGAHVIALDATARPRPDGEHLEDLIPAVRRELGLPVMADCATFEEAMAAEALGADLLATTLCGYTEQTLGAPLPALELVARIAAVARCPVICEGGVAAPEQAAEALGRGAYACVVGTAITNVDALTRTFASAVEAKAKALARANERGLRRRS